MSVALFGGTHQLPSVCPLCYAQLADTRVYTTDCSPEQHVQHKACAERVVRDFLAAGRFKAAQRGAAPPGLPDVPCGTCGVRGAYANMSFDVVEDAAASARRAREEDAVLRAEQEARDAEAARELQREGGWVARLNGATPQQLTDELFAAIDDHHGGRFANALLAGADLNRDNAQGVSPLTRAVQRHRIDMARQLLAAGADANHEDRWGRRADQFAGSAEMRLLIQAHQTPTDVPEDLDE